MGRLTSVLAVVLFFTATSSARQPDLNQLKRESSAKRIPCRRSRSRWWTKSSATPSWDFLKLECFGRRGG
jgi:hypothetical protein